MSPPDSDAEAQMGEPGSDAGVVARSEDANGIGVEGEDVERTAPEVLEHVYQPLLQSLKTECRRILGAAETEAENVRSKAQDEARRILTDAHRERSSLFRRATSKQALMYEEADADIQRWLDELDEERQATLDRAHDDAARLLRMAAQQAETYAHERREAADREAQAIVVEARLEAAKYRGEPTQVGAEAPPTVSPPATPVTTASPRLPKSSAIDAEVSDPSASASPTGPPPERAVVVPPLHSVSALRESPPSRVDPSAAPPLMVETAVVESPLVETLSVESPVVELQEATEPPEARAGDGIRAEEVPSDVEWMTIEPKGAVSAPSLNALQPSVSSPEAAHPSATVADVQLPSRRERRLRRRFGFGKSGR